MILTKHNFDGGFYLKGENFFLQSNLTTEDHLKEVMESNEIVEFSDTPEGKSQAQAKQDGEEREWRNLELAKLDFLINDYEDRTGKRADDLRAKRVILRDYPATEDFKKKIRPQV